MFTFSTLVTMRSRKIIDVWITYPKFDIPFVIFPFGYVLSKCRTTFNSVERFVSIEVVTWSVGCTRGFSLAPGSLSLWPGISKILFFTRWRNIRISLKCVTRKLYQTRKFVMNFSSSMKRLWVFCVIPISKGAAMEAYTLWLLLCCCVRW
jgi:hypothetical protein